MYKEEKVIDGVLCVRYSPGDFFKPYSAEALTGELLAMKAHLRAIQHVVFDEFLLTTSIKEEA